MYPAAGVAQQSAACVSLTGPPTGVIVLSALTAKASSELVPAKLRINRPALSKTNANGTGPAAGFLTGAADSLPSGPTEYTSTVPWVFVVTIRWAPSGVKPTSAVDARKKGLGVLPRSSVRVEASIG